MKFECAVKEIMSRVGTTGWIFPNHLWKDCINRAASKLSPLVSVPGQWGLKITSWTRKIAQPDNRSHLMSWIWPPEPTWWKERTSSQMLWHKCEHMSTNTLTHIYKHTQIHSHQHTLTHTYKHTYIQTQTHTNTQTKKKKKKHRKS